MNQATKGTSLAPIRIKDRGEITLPPQVLQALTVGIGDHLHLAAGRGRRAPHARSRRSTDEGVLIVTPRDLLSLLTSV